MISNGDFMSREKAIKYYKLARYMANQFSRDPSTKVGALLLAPRSLEILSMGYNGMPRGIDDTVPARLERPTKYLYTEHAERNALYNANRRGISLQGAYGIATLCPCADCARGFIQSGVEGLVTHKQEMSDNRWDASFDVGQEMMLEAGIQIMMLSAEEVAE